MYVDERKIYVGQLVRPRLRSTVLGTHSTLTWTQRSLPFALPVCVFDISVAAASHHREGLVEAQWDDNYNEVGRSYIEQTRHSHNTNRISVRYRVSQ